MSGTQTLERPGRHLRPPDVPETTRPLDAEGQCELFDYFIQAIDEFAELDPDDLSFLESHLAACPTGKHSEDAFEDAMGLPRAALRRGSLEHGLSSPQLIVELSFAMLEALRESGANFRSRPSPPTAAEDDLSKRQQAAAAAYPGEHVVLQGTEVLYHSSSRREAFDAYDRAHVEEGGFYPVLVLPGHDEPRVPPVFRGRSLTA